MARQRGSSNASSSTSLPDQTQELGSMYDYLAKVILLGPSGAGKSVIILASQTLCAKSTYGNPVLTSQRWNFYTDPVYYTGRVLSSQTIGVEFSSKVVKVGTGSRRKRIKLQLWDTAGTERFRSVSRSYYRGAAGAILIYDVASHASFAALPTFLMDARALASPNLTVLLAGNKTDLVSDSTSADEYWDDPLRPPVTSSSSISSKQTPFPFDSAGGSLRSVGSPSVGTRMTATISPEGREISLDEASRWASKSNIPVAVEVSALSGDNVDELFNRLARIILTKIELGEIDPDDPQSGIQYGDGGMFGTSDGGSIRSGITVDDSLVQPWRRKPHMKKGTTGWSSGMREWEDVFRLGGSNQRRGRCC